MDAVRAQGFFADVSPYFVWQKAAEEVWRKMCDMFRATSIVAKVSRSVKSGESDLSGMAREQKKSGSVLISPTGYPEKKQSFQKTQKPRTVQSAMAYTGLKPIGKQEFELPKGTTIILPEQLGGQQYVTTKKSKIKKMEA